MGVHPIKDNKKKKRKEYITCLMTPVLDTRFAHNSIASLYVCVHVGFIYCTWFTVHSSALFTYLSNISLIYTITFIYLPLYSLFRLIMYYLIHLPIGFYIYYLFV